MKKIKRNNQITRPPSSRVLIVGCGDIGMRILPLLRTHFSIFAFIRQPEHADSLRAAGAIPVVGNLDDPPTLARLARLASLIIYLAPPAQVQDELKDRRSRRLAAILSHRCRMVYVSTTGVYGDCQGAIVDETRRVNPRNARAVRRVDAENVWRGWARRTGSCVSILRVPGIYAPDRLPIERIKKGVPALLQEEDVYTNHIHADDLTRLVIKTLFYGRPNRIYNAVDDSSLLMGDYFDRVADKLDLPRVPRLARSELMRQVNSVTLSFMSESRRISNHRIKSELGFRFLYPEVSLKSSTNRLIKE